MEHLHAPPASTSCSGQDVLNTRTELDLLQLRNLREILWSRSIIEAHGESTVLLEKAEDAMEWACEKSTEAQARAEIAVANLHHFNNYISQHLWKTIQRKRRALEGRFQAYRQSESGEHCHSPTTERNIKLALFEDIRELQRLSDYRVSLGKRLVDVYMQCMSEQNIALAHQIQSMKIHDEIYEKYCLLDEEIEKAHRCGKASLLNLIILRSVARQQNI